MSYYLPAVYCALPSYPVIGSVLIGSVLFLKTLAIVLAGVSFLSTDLALSFLLLWVYNAVWYFHLAAQQEYGEPAPACTLLSSTGLEAVRPSGFPVWDVLSLFTLSSFVVVNQFLTQVTLPHLLWGTVVLSPVIVSVALFATLNASLSQIAVSALIGCAFGVFWCVKYHLFLKWYLFHNFENPTLHSMLYFGDVKPVPYLESGRGKCDHDLLMLGINPELDRQSREKQK
jgi:hypothetical protein